MTDRDEEQLVSLVERWRASPYDFVVECIGAAPTEQQRGVLEAMALPGARVSIRSGHGTGLTSYRRIVARCRGCATRTYLKDGMFIQELHIPAA